MRAQLESSCAICGARLDLRRAPYLRVGLAGQYVFCSVEHAVSFAFPRTETVPPAAVDTIVERADPARAQEPEPSDEAAAKLPSRDSIPETTEAPPPSWEQPSRPDLRRLAATPAQSPKRWFAARPFVVAAIAAATYPLAGRTSFLMAGSLLAFGLAELLAERRSRHNENSELRLLQLDERLHAIFDSQGPGARTGELIRLQAGDIAPIDGTVQSGTGRIESFPLSAMHVSCEPGEPVWAGTRLENGSITVLAKKTGSQSRLVEHTRAIAELREKLEKPARSLPLKGVILGAAMLLTFSLSRDPALPLLVALATYQYLVSPLKGLIAKHSVDSLRERLSSDRVFVPSRHILESLAHVNSLAMFSRGTLVRGAPEVRNVLGFGSTEPTEVLRLAASAESVVTHPLAEALRVELSRRRLSAAFSKNHVYQAGLGVVCSLHSGEELVVGSRELLLRKRVLMASFESELTAMEAEGYLTLLVAKRGRLVGAIAFLDAVHRDAAALVELLKENRVEPVLISGDPTATTETLGQRLGIEHVRPEVHASDRPELIKRLSEGGARMAVMGRAGQDDPSLSVAELAFALGGLGEGLNHAILLVSSNPLTAAKTIATARTFRSRRLLLEVVATIPTALATLMVILGLLPVFALPPLGTISAAILYFVAIRRR